jgi:hypothetical protein
VWYPARCRRTGVVFCKDWRYGYFDKSVINRFAPYIILDHVDMVFFPYEHLRGTLVSGSMAWCIVTIADCISSCCPSVFFFPVGSVDTGTIAVYDTILRLLLQVHLGLASNTVTSDETLRIYSSSNTMAQISFFIFTVSIISECQDPTSRIPLRCSKNLCEEL